MARTRQEIEDAKVRQKRAEREARRRQAIEAHRRKSEQAARQRIEARLQRARAIEATPIIISGDDPLPFDG
jgi:hypothetical protein